MKKKSLVPEIIDCETGEIVKVESNDIIAMPETVCQQDTRVDPFAFCKYRAKSSRVIYKNVNEFTRFINSYFSECDKKKTLYTLPDLANHIGVKVREAFHDYEIKASGVGVPPDYIAAVLGALQKIEGQEIKQAHTNYGYKGACLILTSQFGYCSEKDIENKVENSNLELTIVRATKKSN